MKNGSGCILPGLAWGTQWSHRLLRIGESWERFREQFEKSDHIGELCPSSEMSAVAQEEGTGLGCCEQKGFQHSHMVASDSDFARGHCPTIGQSRGRAYKTRDFWISGI